MSCKRFKVARTGIEPLRELFAAKEAREVHDCITSPIGEVTDNARAFATSTAIKLVGRARARAPAAVRQARTRKAA